MNISQKYAYIRVSSYEQNEERQLVAMRELNIPTENIYMDKLSGKDFNRPSYQRLLNTIKEGDLIYVLSIDRLGRNYEEIQNQWRILTKEKKVDICVIDMPLLDTRACKDFLGAFIADLVLQILSFVAQSEHENIRKRQTQGIAAAKARGTKFGRPEILVPANFADIVNLWRQGQLSLQNALQCTNMSESTFYRKVRKLKLIKAEKPCKIE